MIITYEIENGMDNMSKRQQQEQVTGCYLCVMFVDI